MCKDCVLKNFFRRNFIANSNINQSGKVIQKNGVDSTCIRSIIATILHYSFALAVAGMLIVMRQAGIAALIISLGIFGWMLSGFLSFYVMVVELSSGKRNSDKFVYGLFDTVTPVTSGYEYTLVT